MKTMIENAEKLEKLGELLEVEGNKVTFGGDILVDGNIDVSERGLYISLDAQANATIEKAFMIPNTLYALRFEDGTSMTLYYNPDLVCTSSLGFVFADDSIVYVMIKSLNETTLELRALYTNGNNADVLGNFELEIAPIISFK